MSEEQTAVIQPAEVTAAPTVETPGEEEIKFVQTYDEPEDETPIAKEPAQEPAAEAVKPQEEVTEPEKAIEQPKPSRTEKRIRNLANENRELKAKIDAFAIQSAPEFEQGEMTADDLNKVINERTLQAVELIMASKQNENEYGTQLNKWADDFEKVKSENPMLDPNSPEYDPALDSTLAKLLDDGNGTPRTDIMVSDILKTLSTRESAVQTKAREEGKSTVTVTLVKQMAEGAITPTPQAGASEEYTQEQIDHIQQTNPRLYSDLIEKGKI